jgi:hypothetical protein
MKLLDDPKIPTARRKPRRAHHSHKPLDVTAEMGLKPGRPYCTRRRHHHLSATPTNLDSKNEEQSPQNRERSPPTDKGRDPPRLHGPKTTEMRRSAAAPAGGRKRCDRIAWNIGCIWYIFLLSKETYCFVSQNYKKKIIHVRIAYKLVHCSFHK